MSPQSKAKRLDHVRQLLDHAESHPDAVWALMALADAQEALTAEIGERVLVERAAGASWVRIGVALGLTKQGAQQRYGR